MGSKGGRSSFSECIYVHGTNHNSVCAKHSSSIRQHRDI